MSDSDNEDVPDRDTCQQRIEEFVKITESNEAVAQQFLQENKWELNGAVSTFYEALNDENEKNRKEELDASVEVIEHLFGKGKVVTKEPPPRLLFLTWNIDCLNEKSLKLRIRDIIALVKTNEPDVIFFQEVIDEVADYIDQKLPEYQAVRGNTMGYYTMTLFRIFTIKYDTHSIIEFPDSTMGRNLLVSLAHVGERKFAFLNTHLESTKDFAEERQKQLRRAFKFVTDNIPAEVTVVFGGDLNLRDSEEYIPEGFYDVWKMCGSKAELQYTWDAQRNTNISISGRFKPRLRFDRVYLRPEKGMVAPKQFGLVGLTRVKNSTLFPSDHWGIVILLELKH